MHDKCMQKYLFKLQGKWHIKFPSPLTATTASAMFLFFLSTESNFNCMHLSAVFMRNFQKKEFFFAVKIHETLY